MDIIRILSTVCIALFLLLGLFLIFTKSRRSVSSKLLGLFFILWGINFLDGWLLLSGFYLDHPGLAMWEEPLVFLYGPVIYFYTLSITQKNFSFKASDLSHLMPFLILFLFIFFAFHVQSDELKIQTLQSVIQLKQPISLLFPIIIIFGHIFLYIFLSKRLIAEYQHSLMGFYSSINIDWLNKTLNFLIAILSVSIVNSLIQFLGDQLYFQLGLIVLIVLVVVFIAQVYFKILDQPQLFVSEISVKKKDSGLFEHEKEEIFIRIKKLFEQDHVYLNAELTMEDLANRLQISSRKCSYVINDVFGQNFFDLVNTYRIEYAKSIFTENKDPKATVLEVMYESGFNSKSSFNTQFRKKTGLTPSEFKKLHS